jgi:hypothetical protein
MEMETAGRGPLISKGMSKVSARAGAATKASANALKNKGRMENPPEFCGLDADCCGRIAACFRKQERRRLATAALCCATNSLF